MSMEINPKLKVRDRVILIVMGDPYSPVTVGTKGTVVGIGTDPWSKEPLYYVQWDNGSNLNLIGDEDVWIKEMSDVIKEQVNASPTTLSKIMSTVGPIPKTKMSSSEVIKKILYSEDIPFFNINDDIDLENTLKRLVDKIRFYEYFLSFKKDKDGRGFNYEGLLAGLTGGKPIISQRKEDIKIGDEYYSVKLTQPGERFDLGSLSSGFQAAKIELIEDGYEVDDLKRPIDLMSRGAEFNEYKSLMIKTSFVVGENPSESLKWIFSILNDDHISYCVTDTDSLIDLVIDNFKSGKAKSSISIPQDKVGGVCKQIRFPKVTNQQIKNLLHKKGSPRKDDKIADLFGKYSKNIRFDILQYIRKNPDLFLKRVVDLYGDRVSKIMKEKGLIDLPGEMDESVINILEDDGDKIIKPSSKVIKNICDSKKFCSSQGPITFGQLRSIVGAAKNKRLAKHIGEGGFKAFIRLMPWFIPQIAVAGMFSSGVRALNKILGPTLKETPSYKSWWAKAIMKLFSFAEGDINPIDPFSKIFFIGDGLMNLMNDESKLKFAYHISEVASLKPDDEAVPEFFVENELREWVNRRFLLDPPLGPKNMESFDDVEIPNDLENNDSTEEIDPINEGFIDDMKPLLPIINADKDNYVFTFLKDLRDSGIVNMMQSPEFTWGGRDFLEKYLKIQELQGSYQQIEDEDEKENLLDLASKSQQVMIQAAFSNLQAKSEELSTNNINKELRFLGMKAFKYFTFKL